MASSCEEIVERAFDRGRMYERYREKREAKLREDWFLRMEHKEAQIRAMWHRLEESRPSYNALLPVRNIQEVRSIPSSPSRPQTRKENRAHVSRGAISYSSSFSSPRNLSRSRTINTDPKENRPIRPHSHQRRNTLSGPSDFNALEFEKNSDSDSSRKGRLSKPFLKKGSGIGPGSGPAIVKQRRNIEYNFESGDNSSSSVEQLDEFLRQSMRCSVYGGSESVDSLSNSNNSVRRERKKWVAPEKLEIFSSQSEKEDVTGFKRLMLNIVGKSKNRESLVYDSASLEAK